MVVYKRRGQSSWYFGCYIRATKQRIRRSLNFAGTRAEAQRRGYALEAELREAAETIKSGVGSLTLSQAVYRYIESLEAAGKVAAVNHRYRANRMFGRSATSAGLYSLDPDKLLHTLTPTDMEALKLARQREGRSPQTIRHELSLIRSAARYVGDLGFQTPRKMVKGETTNPWRVPTVRGKTRHLSNEEYQKVYDYLDPERPVRWGRGAATTLTPLPPHLKAARQESQDLLVALAYTGGRWSEIAHLTWERVNMGARRITLWAGKVEKERVVPIADPLHSVLVRRLRDRVCGHHLVFPGPGGRPRTKPSDAIGTAMTEVGLNRADIVAKFGTATIHSLRHTFASRLVERGAALNEVQDVLGHASIVSTVRYAHLGKEATLRKLQGLLDGS